MPIFLNDGIGKIKKITGACMYTYMLLRRAQNSVELAVQTQLNSYSLRGEKGLFMQERRSEKSLVVCKLMRCDN